jgi:hypothetical protein
MYKKPKKEEKALKICPGYFRGFFKLYLKNSKK